jgi:hypothetical protein
MTVATLHTSYIVLEYELILLPDSYILQSYEVHIKWNHNIEGQIEQILTTLCTEAE